MINNTKLAIIINAEGFTPNSLNTIDIPLTPKQTILYLKKNKLNAKATIKHPVSNITYLLKIFFLYIVSTILLILILLPLLTSFILFFVNNNNNKLIRTISIYGTSITFFISIFLLFLFDKSTLAFQGLHEIQWLNFFNLNFSIGIDGISLFFILLTTFLFPICILCSYNYIKFNFKLFYINFLIMESILLLVFSCLDIVFFYVFFEAVLIPMYLILGFFGSRERKILASYMFFIYTFVGSVLMLLAILFIFYYIIVLVKNQLIYKYNKKYNITCQEKLKIKLQSVIRFL